MPLTRLEKQKIIADLKEQIDRQKISIFFGFQGLTTKKMRALREKLRAVEAVIIVTKKTLLGLAFRQKKVKVPIEQLEGQLATIFGFKDEILPAKTLVQFSKQNENIKLLGGYADGKFISQGRILFLANLPSKEVLLSQLIGEISSPISRLVNSLRWNVRALLYLLNTKASQNK